MCDMTVPGGVRRALARVTVLGRIRPRFRRYRRLVGEITRSVAGVVQGFATLPDAPPDDALVFLHVSDIHNNPIAYDVIANLVDQYHAAAVLDTGDIGDWGRSFEAATFERIADIHAPYLFIKGNHDSARTLGALRRHPNVRIVDIDSPTDVDGVRISGRADPRFTPDKSTGDDYLPAERLAANGREFASAAAKQQPDIAMVHDPAVGAELAGIVPLVLAGHLHQRGERMLGTTRMLVQGSSGGAGLRGVRQRPADPLTVSALLLDRDTKKLCAVDDYTIGGLGEMYVECKRRSVT